DVAVEHVSWYAPSNEPADCLVNKLKRITILGLIRYTHDPELELIAYILSNATVLEALHIRAPYRFFKSKEDLLSSGNDVCKSLFELPRASSTCVIWVTIDDRVASSNDYKDGIVVFQVAIHDRHLFINSVRDQCKLGFTDLNHPISLFRQLIYLRPLPSVIDFNQLFTSMLKLKNLKPHLTIISFSSNLELSGVRPDRYSMGILANCYCHLGRIDFGFSLMGKSLKLGYPPNCITFTTLINGFIHCDKLPQAVQLLDKIVKLGFQPDIVTYGAMIKGLCRIGDNVGALSLLHKMQSEGLCKPNLLIYTTIIDSLCEKGLLKEGLDLFSEQAKGVLDEMIESKIAPNLKTYNMVEMFCEDGSVDDAHTNLELMIERGLTPDIDTYNGLLNGYCLRGHMKGANKIRYLMEKNNCEPDLLSFNAMINGYVKLKNIDKALKMFQELLLKRIKPDVFTYSTLIDGLCKARRITHANQLFTEMQAQRVTPNVVTYNSLLDGLCKTARFDEARAILKDMGSKGVQPDTVSFLILR
ncbi:hypothetical protein SOVF_183070 isoform B, partial [Spinacia oleracea]